DPGAVAVLQPEPVPFVSYPYEWSFGMLRDAALLTLDIQLRALDRGFVLKDASAYNVLFRAGRPVFIDTLSFERYRPGEPWIAYAQFCRHFLAPLALIAKIDVRLGSLLGTHLDGVPLDLASRLLPGSTKFKPGLLTHIHLHAKALGQPGVGPAGTPRPRVSEAGMRGLIGSLRKAVRQLSWDPKGTEWSDYYSDTNYSAAGTAAKAAKISEWLIKIGGRTCWDLGANNGRYSRLAADAGYETLAADFDPAAVEQAYRFVRESNERRIHPLVLDLVNPTPARGWAGTEREGIFERGPADVALALALIHHLAIANNVPLPDVLATLARMGRSLVVEWVPKDDSQIQRMMVARRDVFADYGEDAFRSAVPPHLEIADRAPIPDSGRVLYLLRPR
ncbi:MAG: class I SAM-dependent methyltransferase, partial [Fimbriimonadaceae bacterium]